MLRVILLTLLLLPATARAADPVFQAPAKPKQLLDKGAGEGPAWHPRLGLLFSGEGDINRFGLDGKRHPYRKGAGTNGLLFDRDGNLLLCQPRFRRVARISADGRKFTVLTARYEGNRYNQPNDLTVDSKGRIYFSDPQYGPRSGMELVDKAGRKVEGVYRIDPDGSVARVITHEVDRPNGLLIPPGGRYIYVADNNNNTKGGARKLWKFRLKRDGKIDFTPKTLVYDWGTGRGPDGMAVDAKGNLYVAAGRTTANKFETSDKKGGIYVFSPRDKLLTFVPIPNDEVTNCAFGGKDLKTLYVTAGGTLWSIRTTNPGRPVWPPAPKE